MREGSIPLVNRITTETAFVRYHGRNRQGGPKDMTDQEWRDVRYLYNYNKEELTDLANKVRIIEQKLKRFMSYLIITRVGMSLKTLKHIRIC